MSKQPDRECLISPPKSSSVTPPSTPSAASLTAHLLNMKSIYEAQYLESLGLGLNHPALAGALPSSLPGHMASLPPPPPPIHPLLLAGPSPREALFNPWLLARQHSLLGHRLGKQKFCQSLIPNCHASTSVAVTAYRCRLLMAPTHHIVMISYHM